MERMQPEILIRSLRAGGGPVTGISPDQSIVLTAAGAAFVRQALAACSQLLSLARLLGGPGRQALAEAALQADDGRPPGQVHYDVSLAIGYAGFARPARSTR
jgi:hypothetical protein